MRTTWAMNLYKTGKQFYAKKKSIIYLLYFQVLWDRLTSVKLSFQVATKNIHQGYYLYGHQEIKRIKILHTLSYPLSKASTEKKPAYIFLQVRGSGLALAQCLFHCDFHVYKVITDFSLLFCNSYRSFLLLGDAKESETSLLITIWGSTGN